MNQSKAIKSTWMVFVATAIAGLVIYAMSYNLQRGVSFSASNDEWEHQTMAVNFAKGHGLFKLGFYEAPKTYGFKTHDYAFPYLRTFAGKFHTPYYYRNAGTEFYVGLFYKILGVNTTALRLFQYLLACISWALATILLLPFIRNNLSLLIYGLVSLGFYYFSFPIIDLVGDETIQLFANALLFYAYVRWQETNRWKEVLLLILMLIHALFIKSTLVLFPLLLIAYELFKGNSKSRIQILVVSAVAYTFVMMYSNYINQLHRSTSYANEYQFIQELTTANWSAEDTALINTMQLAHDRSDTAITIENFEPYKQIAAKINLTNMREKTWFLMSQQSLYNFIHGNNIYCIEQPVKNVGSYKSNWLINPNSFYFNTKPGLASIIRIAEFYKRHPNVIPTIFWNKLVGGFWGLWFYAVFAFALLLFLIWMPNAYSTLLTKALTGVMFLPCLIFPAWSGLLSFLLSIVVLIRRKDQNMLLNAALLFPVYLILLTLMLHGIYRFTLIANIGVFFSLAFILLLYSKEKPSLQT